MYFVQTSVDLIITINMTNVEGCLLYFRRWNSFTGNILVTSGNSNISCYGLTSGVAQTNMEIMNGSNIGNFNAILFCSSTGDQRGIYFLMF